MISCTCIWDKHENIQSSNEEAETENISYTYYLNNWQHSTQNIKLNALGYFRKLFMMFNLMFH